MSFDLQKTILGIELGSTRIKAVLIDEAHNPIASGSRNRRIKKAISRCSSLEAVSAT